MRKNLLFVFLLMLFIVPLKVKGEEFYFNYGAYNYSEEYVEEKKDLEVEVINDGEKDVYKYRTRDYIIIPLYIVIESRDANIYDYIDTNIPLEQLEVIEYYDLKTMNNCNGAFEIRYKKSVIGKLVSIRIKNYIEVPEEIIVNDYNFEIWNYIETDIQKKEDIVFSGEYDLNSNGEYELLITYNDIAKKTKIIVEIEENNKVLDDEEKDGIKDNVEEEEKGDIADNITQKEEIIEVTIEEKQPITCINNYYEIKEQEKEIEYVDRIVPVNNKTTYDDADYNKYFRYVSYAFYSITTILLSIIVVRKK